MDEVLINTTTAGDQRQPAVCGLQGTQFVVVWEDRSDNTERTMDAPATAAAIAALDGGQFAIAHLNDGGESAPADTLIGVAADVFNADGSPTPIHLVSTSEPRIQATWPNLVPLSRGRFLIAWAQLNSDRPGTTTVKARVFSTQGPLGQVTQCNTSSGHERFSLAAAALSSSDGEFAFAAWADDRQSGGDSAGRAVRGRALRVPAAGF